MWQTQVNSGQFAFSKLKGTFLSVIEQRLSTFLEQNKYADTTMQKDGISGMSCCLEHTSMIWHQIQTVNEDKRHIHVIFPDLAGAFGSVPFHLLWESFAFFHAPSSITSRVKAYNTTQQPTLQHHGSV